MVLLPAPCAAKHVSVGACLFNPVKEASCVSFQNRSRRPALLDLWKQATSMDFFCTAHDGGHA